MKMKQKLISFILTLTIAMGLATAPAFATSGPLLVESYWEEYLKGDNGSWAASTSNLSLPTVPSKYGNSWAKALLNQLYYIWREVDYINTALSSSSSVQSSNFGKAMYYLGSATFQNKISNIESYLYNVNGYLNTINGYLNTYLPDLKSGITSANQHLGSISSMLGYSNSNTLKSNIDSVISGITSSNTNTSNIKSVLDNLYGALGYTSASNLKTAISSIISNTSDISGIKSGTDYLDDIAADTASLPTIENNTSAIKINSDYLPGINTYASNLPAIKANTDYLDDIYNAVSSISVPTYDFENIKWIEQSSLYQGIKLVDSNTYLSSATNTNIFDVCFYLRSNVNVYKIRVPFVIYYAADYDFGFNFYAQSADGTKYKINDLILNLDFTNSYVDITFIVPDQYYYLGRPFALTVESSSNVRIVPDNPHSAFYIENTKKDYYEISNNLLFRNIYNYLKHVDDIIYDPISEAAKSSNVGNQTTVLTNFTGSGAGSASSTDFIGVKDSVTQLKSALSGGVSYSQTFNIFGGSSDGWSWFSQEVADSMDSTSQSRNLLRGNISSSTPYLDSYYDSIYSVIGIGGDIE